MMSPASLRSWAATRADDIVRDADILHLYKKAGWQRFLLGLENTDEALKLIKKGATVFAAFPSRL